MPQKYINLNKTISEIKLYPLCLGDISKGFTAANMKKHD